MIQKKYLWKAFNVFEEKFSTLCKGSGLTKNQQKKNGDTPMTFYHKTVYWRPLVPNAESVDDTTNPYFFNPYAPFVAET